MNKYKNPKWWSAENDSGWERTKAAFKRDWDQTKHDMGGDEPDTDQDVNNTLKQAAGKEAIPPRGAATYEEMEPAYRFGHGARSHYGDEFPEWNDKLEARLQSDWRSTNPSRAKNWDSDAAAIRQGWSYEDNMDDEDAETSTTR